MNLLNIKKVELEITSDCNAACPGCARTQNFGKFLVTGFGLADIKRLFPSREYIAGKQFKFCGVLGDPALNIECVDMVEYLSTNGGFCQLSTNGGYQTATWWHRLGELSKETKNVEINFCIDGHRETNHVYRVNTNFKVIDRNMQAYRAGGAGHSAATWIFIVFDHNEYELPAAEAHAKSLGFKFATRTGMRNSYHDWVSIIKKRDANTKKLVTEQSVITTSGKKEHTKKQQVYELAEFIENYKNNDSYQTQRVVSSITCKYVHEAEIFISAQLEVWPCCFLWDSTFKNRDQITDKLSKYTNGWNSVKDQDIDAVLSHDWFSEVLEQSWNPAHAQHLSRCILTCAHNKAYHNEITIKQ